MNQEQLLSANLHHPKVTALRIQLSDGGAVVELGNRKYAQSVYVFFENLDALKEFIRSLELEVAMVEQAPVNDALAASGQDS